MGHIWKEMAVAVEDRVYRLKPRNSPTASMVNTSASDNNISVHSAGTAAPEPESTEGRPLGQPLKKPEGAPLNLG